ncbi:MAG: geranylgeranyl reductase family protein [Candidatus Bipolaricaulia bacterium]
MRSSSLGSERFDVVVVGSGPAGSAAARTAAESGARVLMLEEHQQVGSPVQCTGLLSVRGVEETGASQAVLIREITGAFVYAPDGRRLEIRGREAKAWVIDRGELDRELARRAEAAGVEVRTGVRAIDLEPETGTLRILNDGREGQIQAGVVVGADGPKSQIAAWAGLPPPQKLIFGFQAVVPYRAEHKDFVEVFLGNDLAPNFFAWAVPETDGYAKIGLGTDAGRQGRVCFDRLLARTATQIDQVRAFQGGLIPIGPAAHTVSDRILLVGDAAGQSKPTSGGGIYTGTVCGKIAGEVAASCALAGETSNQALSEYERRWRRVLGRELAFGMQFHQLLCRLSDPWIDRIFTLLDDPKVLNIITEFGDIDYTSRLTKALAKSPRFWGRFATLLPGELDGLIRSLK